MIQIIGAVGIVAIVWVLAIVILAAIRDRRDAEARARFDRELTEKEIERNISADILSKERPYAPGLFGNDEAGRHYVAGVDGAVRRVHIVPTADGGETIMAHRKLPKAERKKRKRAIREARELAAHRVQTSAHHAGHGALTVSGTCGTPTCEYSGPASDSMTTDDKSHADCEERGTLTPTGFIPEFPPNEYRRGIGPFDGPLLERGLRLRADDFLTIAERRRHLARMLADSATSST